MSAGVTVPTLADSMTAAAAAVNANAAQYFTLEQRVALREAAAVLAGSITPSDDVTELAQALCMGVSTGTFGGTPNALTGAIAGQIVFPALRMFMAFWGVPAADNAGAVTITLGGFATPPGPLPLKRRDGSDLQAGDLKQGKPFGYRYNGLYYELTGPGATENGTAATLALVSRLRFHREFLNTPGSGSWSPLSGIIGPAGTKAWGAGGGGAANTGSAGGAGELAYGEFAANLNGNPYVIGAGSAGVPSGNAGNGGLTQIFGMTAMGGYGGGSTSTYPGVGGTGGTGGLWRKDGGAGQDLDGNEVYAAGGTAAEQPSAHYGRSAANTAEGGYASPPGGAPANTASAGGPGGLEFAYLLLAA